jgi:hypothetical protein
MNRAFGDDSCASQRIKLEYQLSTGVPDCDRGAKGAGNFQAAKTALRIGRTSPPIYRPRIKAVALT